MKRIICLLLVFAILLPCMGIKAYATSTNLCGEKLTWDYDTSTGVLMISGTGNMWNFGYNKRPWEEHSPTIKSIIIEDGVSGIGAHAFSSCTALTSISIPESVTYIGERSFYNCSTLTNLTLTEGLNNIGYGSFSSCKALSNLTIPNSVTIIEPLAFSGCNSLTHVTIGENVASIGYFAFSGCTSLTSVTFPTSLTNIGEAAFDYDVPLHDVYYAGSKEQKKHIIIEADNIPLYSATWHFDEAQKYSCGDNLTWVLDDTGILTISGTGDMWNFTHEDVPPWHGQYSDIISVVIEEGVSSVGSDAFWGCDSLVRVALPDTLTHIGDHAFMLCTTLTDIIIPDNLIQIGIAAFSDCSSLESITIPGSVVTISSSAFQNCTALKNLTLCEDVTQIGSIAFSNCDALTSVTIPGSVTSIDHFAFAASEALTHVTICEGVTTIYDFAFECCDALKSISIPASMTTIIGSAFECCDSLCDVYYNGTEEMKELLFSNISNTPLGKATWHCRVCEHIFSEWETVTAATCTDSGKEIRNCANCIATESRIIPANGHNYDAVVTEPTCKDKGFTTYTCYCGDSYVNDYTDSLNHSFTKYISNNDATCTEDGTETAKCDRCNSTASRRQTGSALGHDMDKWTMIQNATCSTDGQEVSQCSRCDHREIRSIPAKGHTEVTDKAVSATCTTAGKTEGKHCSTCNTVLMKQETIPAKGHTEVIDQAVAATCTTAGKTEGKHCSTCNTVLVKQETIPAKGHTEVIDQAVVATCTTAGKTEGKHCSTCNVVLVKQETVPAKGHTEVTDKAVSATCTTAGKTEGKHCSTCNTVLVKQETVPAKGHTEVTDKAVSATCTTAGKTEGKHCSTCNEVLVTQETVPATGHAKVIDEAVAPTCTTVGKTEGEHCSVCKEILIAQDEVPTISHSFSEWAQTKAPTVTDEGEETRACANCSYCEIRTIEPIALAAPTIKASAVTATGKTKLSWESVSGADFYRVYRATSKTGKFKYLKSTRSTALTDTTAEIGRNYYYKVLAVNEETEATSEFSNIVNRVCDLAKPTVSITGSSTSGKPIVKWETVEGAAKYRIYRSTSTSSGFELVYTGITARSYTDKTAEAGIKYYYKVKAVHSKSSANSAYSEVVSRVCDLAKPTVSITGNSTSGKPVVKWETVEGAAKYRVYRSTDKDSGYELVYTGITARSYTDKTAETGINYYYKVKAVHGKTSAADSAYSGVINRVCALPKPVVEITLTAGGSPRLTWEPIEGAAKYRVYRCDTEDGKYKLVKTTVSATSYTDKAAAEGQTWYYKVIALHKTSSANSAYSTIGSITAE